MTQAEQTIFNDIKQRVEHFRPTLPKKPNPLFKHLRAIGVKQDSIADIIGVKQSSISNLANGLRPIKDEKYEVLMMALERSIKLADLVITDKAKTKFYPEAYAVEFRKIVSSAKEWLESQSKGDE
jgi:transcriptional regulator with XRE-family HTH domain